MNLLSNPSFEIGDLAGWIRATSFWSRSSIYAQHGSYSARATDPTGTYAHRELRSPIYPALPGTEYFISVWFLIEDTGGGYSPEDACTHVRVRAEFLDSDMNRIGWGAWTPSNPNLGWTNTTVWGTWIYKEFSSIAPAGTAYTRLILNAREVNNPNPPPTGQPDNNVYFDNIYFGPEAYTEYESGDHRVDGAVGIEHSLLGGMVVGEVMDRGNWTEHSIVGTILTYMHDPTFLVVGELEPKIDWLDAPDEIFLDLEDRHCNHPHKRLLLFHDSFPDNPDRPGPEGQLKYIDITDRVISYGGISRDIPKNPAETAMLTMGDLLIELDNSDGYFSTENPASPYYGIEDYVGWVDGGRAELWTGFLFRKNWLKLIQVAKMVVVHFMVDTESGTARLNCRDYVARMLDKIQGKPRPDYHYNPLEYPVQYLGGGTGFLKIRTNLIPTWVDVTIGPAWMGKLTRAHRMEKAMNKAYGDGGLVTDEERFSVRFDEEEQKYTFRGSGKNFEWLRVWTSGCYGAEFWGLDMGVLYPEGDEFETGSVAGDTITFQELLLNLLEKAGFAPGPPLPVGTPPDTPWASVPSLPHVTFKNVSWEGVPLLTCINDLILCGCGIGWITRQGNFIFRRFEHLAGVVRKKLESGTNYHTVEYANQDADLRIRALTVEGKFDGVIAEIENPMDVGSEYSISSPIIETKELAEEVAAALYRRYNLEPAELRVGGEYLPSLDMIDTVIVTPSDDGIPRIAQITGAVLGPTDFTHAISVIPFQRQKYWLNREDFDSHISESGHLIVPRDSEDLQLLLHYGSGSRVYEFDCDPSDPTAKAKWTSFNYEFSGDSRVIYTDQFDVDPLDRYTKITARPQGWPSAGVGPVTWENGLMRIGAMGENIKTFMRLDDLFDESPPLSVNYKVVVDFYIDNIFGVNPENIPSGKWPNVQSRLHCFCILTRMVDDLTYYYSLSRAVGGGYVTPLLGYLQGGAMSYLTSLRLANAGPFREWCRAECIVHQNQLSYEVLGRIPKIQATAPVYNPWPFPARIAVGFIRSLGLVSRIQVEWEGAANAADPVIEFSTKESPSESWTSYSTSLPTVASKYIRVRVSLSRASKYDSVPAIRSMALAYVGA